MLIWFVVDGCKKTRGVSRRINIFGNISSPSFQSSADVFTLLERQWRRSQKWAEVPDTPAKRLFCACLIRSGKLFWRRQSGEKGCRVSPARERGGTDDDKIQSLHFGLEPKQVSEKTTMSGREMPTYLVDEKKRRAFIGAGWI